MAKLVDLGGVPVNQAEWDVVKRLCDDLPGGWSVIPNASLPEPRTGHSYEYDAICVGPHAVYVVEVKGWRGRVRQLGQADWQLEGGRVERNPLPLADQKARVLASHLKAALPGPNRPYVQACLSSGSDETVFEVNGSDARRCLRPSELVPYLLDAGRLGRPNSGAAAGHAATVKAVTGSLAGRRSVGRRYGSWLTTDVQERDDERIVWLGKHALLEDGRAARICAWYLSPYRFTPEQRAAEHARRRRAADALARVGDHPRIARLLDFGESEGEFYEVTEWILNGTLLTAFVQGSLARMNPERQLRIVRDIAEALDAAAEHGVCHRALAPEAVLIDAEGRARLTGFDLAYMEGAAGTVYGGAPAPHAAFVAPELRNPKDYEVFDNSDLYALAKTCRLIFPDSLSDGVNALLDRCMAEDPSDRPENPAAFLKELDALTRPTEAVQVARASSEGIVAGDTLDGVNVVIAELGRGVGATVYRVANEPLGRELALKLVTNPPDGYDAGAEYRLLRSVESPHVARAHWLGRLTRPEGGYVPYLLLDLVDGERLSDIIARAPIPVDRALGWGDDILAALDALHRAGATGVLHRDVKPDNIVVGANGAVLVDFGAARDGASAGSAPEGTLRVCPPDLGETGWQPQADVFAAACVIYEMLAGRLPWDGAPSAKVFPVAVDALREDVLAPVAAVIARALRPHAADRFIDAASFRTALALSRAAPPVRAGTRTSLAAAIEDAGESMWTAARVQALTRHPDLLVPLAVSLRACVMSPTDDSPEAARDALLASEARAAALESPLPDAMPQTYDAFVAGRSPAPIDDGEPDDPRAAPLVPGRVLAFDALHFTEWSVIEDAARVLGRRLGLLAWTPALGAGLASGFESGISEERVVLARGDRAIIGLGDLMAARRRAIEDALLTVLSGPDPLYVGASEGLVYLGHGIRRDVGEGLGDRGDATRAAWAAAFPTGRSGFAGNALPCRLVEPTRTAAGRCYPVGRLAWPDSAGTPWLQSGGLSLPERVQLIFLLET